MSLFLTLRTCRRVVPRLTRCVASSSSSPSQPSTAPESSRGQGALVPLPPRLLPIDEGAGVPKPPRRARFGGTAIVLGIIPLFTFGLGIWQIQRLQWKVTLIEELDEKLSREPIPLPPRINVDVLPEFAFRKVRLTGSWDHAHTMFFGPKKYDVEHGFNVIVPLKRTNGTTIFVNRGFVSNAHMNDYLAATKADPGRVCEVLGMLHAPGERNSYTPDNKPEEGEWYWLDLEAMKQHAGGDEARVQTVLVDEIFNSHSVLAMQNIARGIPVGIPPTIELRNQHAVYAATWFSLSAVTSVLFVRLILKGRGPSAAFNKPPRRQ